MVIYVLWRAYDRVGIGGIDCADCCICNDDACVPSVFQVGIVFDLAVYPVDKFCSIFEYSDCLVKLI